MTRPVSNLSLSSAARALFELMELDPLPVVEPVTSYPRGVDLGALTEQERGWLQAALDSEAQP